jgi:hypothetical protein
MSFLFQPRTAAHRLLCLVLALLMAGGPAAPASAQTPSAGSGGAQLGHVVPGACVVVVLRPKQLAAAPVLQLAPLEVIQAAGMKAMGLDPLQADSCVLSVAPPMQGPPAYAVHAQFATPYRLKPGELTQHTSPGELNGKKYLQSQHPLMPSFFAPNSTSLLVAPDSALATLLDGASAQDPVASQVAAAAAGDDLYLLINLDTLQPLIQVALTQVPPDFPAEARPLLDLPGLLKSVELTVNVSNSSMTELVVTANSEPDAQRVESILGDMKELMIATMTAEMQKDQKTQLMLASEDPVEQAMGRYLQRLQDASTQSMRDFQLSRDGARFHLIQFDPSQSAVNPLAATATIGILVALLLPAVQAAREAARRQTAMNHLKMIMLAHHNYADRERGTFPPHAIYSADGKPLLSWRVSLLPYLEEQALYDRFHLDEPWDSPHNQTLIPLMPEVYLDPSGGLTPQEGRTHFLGVVGEGMLLGGTAEGRRFAAIRDGTSNTIAVLQVTDQRAATWTKPDDWQLDANNVTQGLGGPHPGGFLAGLCDGSVHFISSNIDPNVFRAMLTIAGGEAVNLHE